MTLSAPGWGSFVGSFPSPLVDPCRRGGGGVSYLPLVVALAGFFPVDEEGSSWSGFVYRQMSSVTSLRRQGRWGGGRGGGMSSLSRRSMIEGRLRCVRTGEQSDEQRSGDSR